MEEMIMDVLCAYFKDEVHNKIIASKNNLIIELADGKCVKIYAKKIG